MVRKWKERKTNAWECIKRKATGEGEEWVEGGTVDKVKDERMEVTRVENGQRREKRGQRGSECVFVCERGGGTQGWEEEKVEVLICTLYRITEGKTTVWPEYYWDTCGFGLSSGGSCNRYTRI